jgi:hypothetical protein
MGGHAVRPPPPPGPLACSKATGLTYCAPSYIRFRPASRFSPGTATSSPPAAPMARSTITMSVLPATRSASCWATRPRSAVSPGGQTGRFSRAAVTTTSSTAGSASDTLSWCCRGARTHADTTTSSFARSAAPARLAPSARMTRRAASPLHARWHDGPNVITRRRSRCVRHLLLLLPE